MQKFSAIKSKYSLNPVIDKICRLGLGPTGMRVDDLCWAEVQPTSATVNNWVNRILKLINQDRVTMLHLQEMAKQGEQVKSLKITERLPKFFTAPCTMQVTYQVEAKDDFYLIHLHVKGELYLQCQRCLEEFCFPYNNQTVIAVCRNEERAEDLIEHYECIVSSNWQVNLDDLIIDELHLYAPQLHPQINDCGSEINQFLAS